MPIVVEGVAFRASGTIGDFKWMITHPAYANTILVFNDNVVDASDASPRDGAGSAGIRTCSWKYAPSVSPRAIGIPTGWAPLCGGFQMLSSGVLEPFAARAITLAIERLVLACIQFPNVERIVFSSDPTDTTKLGCSVFQLDPRILDFIKTRLDAIPERVACKDAKLTLSRVAELDEQILAVATLHRDLRAERRGAV